MDELPAPELGTILYVDDEPMARKYFARTIQHEFYVLTAGNVDEALILLSDPRNTIDVVVTDYRMPGKQNGSDLLEMLARERPHVVTILVTAFASVDVLLQAVNNGNVFRVFTKPFKMDDMILELRDASLLVRERLIDRNNRTAIKDSLAFLSHELLTPICAIDNFAVGIERLTNEQNESSPIHHAALQIKQNVRYCQGLLAAYIAAHAHSEIHALRPNDTAANMITKILTGFPLTPSQRNLIRVDIRQDFALRSYPHNVGLAISCLLSNALKAIESVTNPEITILIEVDGTQRISIADTGAGIPQAIVEQLKKDPQTVPRTEQHGWGLLLCNRLMRSFSGTLSFQHMEERKGTKAILTFPNSELMES